MTSFRLRDDAPSRSVSDVGPGDFVKIGSRWERVEHNSAQGQNANSAYPWTVRTENGVHGGFGINRYAKAEDMEQI